MKRLSLLLFTFAAISWSQSDCGNCWSVGYGCNNPNKDSECYIPGSGCQECAWYFVCDNSVCNYHTAIQCWCPASALTTQKCINAAEKATRIDAILRQKATNYKSLILGRKV